MLGAPPSSPIARAGEERRAKPIKMFVRGEISQSIDFGGLAISMPAGQGATIKTRSRNRVTP